MILNKRKGNEKIKEFSEPAKHMTWIAYALLSKKIFQFFIYKLENRIDTRLFLLFIFGIRSSKSRKSIKYSWPTIYVKC